MAIDHSSARSQVLYRLQRLYPVSSGSIETRYTFFKYTNLTPRELHPNSPSPPSVPFFFRASSIFPRFSPSLLHVLSMLFLLQAKPSRITGPMTLKIKNRPVASWAYARCDAIPDVKNLSAPLLRSTYEQTLKKRITIRSAITVLGLIWIPMTNLHTKPPTQTPTPAFPSRKTTNTHPSASPTHPTSYTP